MGYRIASWDLGVGVVTGWYLRGGVTRVDEGRRPLTDCTEMRWNLLLGTV
jgi:hypothetical protein